MPTPTLQHLINSLWKFVCDAVQHCALVVAVNLASFGLDASGICRVYLQTNNSLTVYTQRHIMPRFSTFLPFWGLVIPAPERLFRLVKCSGACFQRAASLSLAPHWPCESMLRCQEASIVGPVAVLCSPPLAKAAEVLAIAGRA